ncbi:MAG TPA: hypothetical protein VGC41_08475 [Kofleriaceae bacterium]
MRITLALLLLSACTFGCDPDNDDNDIEPTQPPSSEPGSGSGTGSNVTCPDLSKVYDAKLVSASGPDDSVVIADGGTGTFFVDTISIGEDYIVAPFSTELRSTSSSVTTSPETWPGVFSIRAHTGTALVEIVEPCTNRILGATEIVSAPLDRAGLEPYELPTVLAPPTRYAYTTDTEFTRLVLRAADGTALVDDSAVVLGTGISTYAYSADLVMLDHLAEGQHSYTVTVGGHATPGTIDLVDHAERIAVTFAYENAVCFGAFVGDDLVTGLAWSFVVNGRPVTGGGSTGSFAVGANCVIVDPVASSVTATSGGVTFSTTY